MAPLPDTQMTPLRQVAVLLASLSEEVSAAILQQLDPNTLNEVAEEIASLGVVTGEKRQQALQFCMKGIAEMGRALHGDAKTANALLVRAIGEKRAATILQEKATPEHQAFSEFSGATAEEVGEVLLNEQPGIISIVLRHLPFEVAGDVLRMLSEDARKQTMLFMASAAAPSPDVIARVEAFMASKMKKGKHGPKFQERDNLDIVAGILQQVDRSIEEEVMSVIEEKSGDIATAIRDKLFTFDDIVRLSNTAMRRILSEIDTSILTLALRGASIDLREKIFNNMSKRGAAAIKEEMEFSPKAKISDVESKRKEIVSVIRTLESSGEITVGQEAEDQYV